MAFVKPPLVRAAPAQRLVLPVAGGSEELFVHQWAVSLARSLDVPLCAVHITDGAVDPPEDLFAHLTRFAQVHSVDLQHVVLHGHDVVAELRDELSATDLVIIGSRRLGTQEFGSIAEALVRTAPCPVQVLRID